MADLIEFPHDGYKIHVRVIAAWLSTRQPHLVTKLFHAEVNRYHGALQRAGLSFQEAHERACVFASDVQERMRAVEAATLENPAAELVHIGLSKALNFHVQGGAA